MRTAGAGKRQRGTTLIETMIATAICMVVVFGLAALVTTATRQSKNMGATVSQATALAAQKLEELMNQEFSGTIADTGTVCGTVPCIASQLCPCATPPCTCGSLTSSANSFSDYLKNDGTATTSTAADLYFTRRWQVEALTTLPATVRRISVRVEGKTIGTASSSTSAPSATVVCYKGQQ